MKNILIILALLILSVSLANADSIVCTITEIDNSILPEGSNNTLVLECDSVDSFVEGQTVKVKIKKNKNTIEGC
jgi:hypothetical protein